MLVSKRKILSDHVCIQADEKDQVREGAQIGAGIIAHVAVPERAKAKTVSAFPDPTRMCIFMCTQLVAQEMCRVPFEKATQNLKWQPQAHFEMLL